MQYVKIKSEECVLDLIDMIMSVNSRHIVRTRT